MMQFDWTTFILEILNFLVLVWILQRFLYRPVLAMLDARQQRIKDETEQAAKLRNQAEALRQQYEQRLAAWNQEQETSRRQLEEELAQLRNTATENLKQNLADEEAKLRVRNQTLIAGREAALVREAAGAAYGQAAAILQRLASPQLTQTIVEVFLQDLLNMPDSEQTALRKAGAMLIAASAVEVLSAHPLSEADQARVTEALSTAAGQTLQITFKEDSALIAGLRAIVGECQLHANLADELAFFRRQANHG
ncbi:F0F1 ATP synthase subunit B [Methylomonas sp. LW13]|uniref:F0F1 ATP synthase subunit delta n=1 Tax=unclassified Methylomonas TaxID=2608980 RepID=UPI000A05E045|nr:MULTISPECIES: F0F1 ATP synthase subunit delta [unclassified Methylomonas]PKD39074.1 F0F1 ATP synthase subunit B [Methylomonas sp. Kb3]QBC29328.1 F0F1 ATP synthase subunit B [Methylomonas sp. LW13]